MWMILTVAAAVGGGLLLQKLKFPGGMMVGSILGAAALSLATEQAFIYAQTKVIAQTLTGAYIGSMVTREDVCHLPKLLRPYLTIMASLLLLNLGMAAIFYRLTDFDLLTCLFCAAPGGMSDIPLISMDMGADSSVVAVMQFVRMLFGMGCLPTIIMVADRFIEPEAAQAMEERAAQLQRERASKRKVTLVEFLPTFVLALAAGILGKLSGMPAGALSFALIVTAALKIGGRCPGMPMWLRRVAQVISGCCIGSVITRSQMLQMGQLALPAVLLCLGYLVCCVGVGLLVSKLFHVDLREAMLTLSPAGASEMALIAADLGVESANLVVLQICRLVGVLLFFPHIFNLILALVL